MCLAERSCVRLTACFLAVLLAVLCLQGAVPAHAADGAAEEELGSSRYTQPLEEGAPPEGHTLEGFRPLLENETLAVYYREAVGGVRVQDKRSGYVWGAMAQDQPENMNQRWAAIANSVIYAEVYDGEGKLQYAGAAGPQLRCTVRGETAVMDVEWPDWSVAFTFEMTLENSGLRFSLRDETIREDGAYRLASVTFAPFLGAVEGSTVSGYLFVPDGCGALMRFLSPRNYLQGYEKRIYGADYGVDSLNWPLLSQASASLPLFGVTHGERQNAFLAVAQHGEEYGVIKADPAGVVCDYSRANIKFVYRQLYEQPVSRVGVGIQTVQPARNAVDPEICYYFLTGDDAGYVGMAKRYRALLEEAGVLTRRAWDGVTPLRVDFLCADVQREFIGSSVHLATGLDTIARARSELQADGVAGLQVCLTGWQKGGLHGYDKTAVKTATVYGGQEKLCAPEEDVWLMLAPFSAREGQFDRRTEGAISLSQTLTGYSIDDEALAYRPERFFLKPQTALQALEGQTQALAREGRTRFVLDDMGFLLYGEYLTRREQTRAQVKEAIAQTAERLAQQYGPLTIRRPNAYLLGAAGAYDAIPVVNSQFLYETDSVPFLQIVLSGYMELYAPYSNLSFFSEMDRLKMIDYNTAPTYLLTESDNYALRNTLSWNLPSSCYDDWRAEIAAAYAQVSAVLDHTRGQTLQDRRILRRGFVKNEYEHGDVYVNYTASACTQDGVTVPAKSAVYVERG